MTDASYWLVYAIKNRRCNGSKTNNINNKLIMPWINRLRPLIYSKIPQNQNMPVLLKGAGDSLTWKWKSFLVTKAHSLKVSKFQIFKVSNFKVSKSRRFKLSETNFRHFKMCGTTNSEMIKQTPISQNKLFFKMIWIFSRIIWSVLVTPKINSFSFVLRDTFENPEIIQVRGLRVLL